MRKAYTGLWFTSSLRCSKLNEPPVKKGSFNVFRLGGQGRTTQHALTHTRKSVHMNDTSANYKRKHINRNIFTTKGGFHPETVIRMVAKGLTPEIMRRANIRRRLLAYKRIHQAHERLKRIREGYISAKEIAIESKSCRKTVKAALLVSCAVVSLQLVDAFRVVDLHTPNNTKIIGCASPVEVESEVTKSASKSLRTAQQRCQRLSTLTKPDHYANGGLVKVSDRAEEERQMAERFMESLKLTKSAPKVDKAAESDGASIKMGKNMMSAYLNRKDKPWTWQAAKLRIDKVLNWKKTDTFPTAKPDIAAPIAGSEHAAAMAREDAEMAARKAALSNKPRIASKPPEIDWEAARLEDERIRREKYNSGELKDKPARPQVVDEWDEQIRRFKEQ
jgi:hypothetical protein